MEAKPSSQPVVPLATLRHRRAVQYCFTPYHDVEKPPRRVKLASGAYAPADSTRYPSENYEDAITSDELSFYRSYCASRYLKGGGSSGRSRGSTAAPASIVVKAAAGPPPARPVSGSGKTRPSRLSKEEVLHEQRQAAIAAFFGTSLNVEPGMLDVLSMSLTTPRNDATVAAPKVEDSSAKAAASPARAHRLASRPNFQLEDKEVLKSVVECRVEKGAVEKVPRVLRRVPYIPPPQPEVCPAWLPVSKQSSSTVSLNDLRSPSKRRMSMRQAEAASQDAEASRQTGRFSPNGGYYIPPTIDDEFFSVPCEDKKKLFDDESDRDNAQRAAAFRRLSRPNVVAEASTTQQEGRVLKYLARRESHALHSPAASLISPATQPLSMATTPRRSVGGTSPLNNNSLSLPPTERSPSQEVSSSHGLSGRVQFVLPTPPSAPPRPAAAASLEPDAERLLTLRDALPLSSRASGCVGSAEVHYWLDLGAQRSKEHARDTGSCIAQVWMRRRIDEESHSARTVLRNYATKIPDDAVLAVTIRRLLFGRRKVDATITFTYKDALSDPAMTGVAETIRKIVKDANTSDDAKFRGPFLICAADADLCEFLRSFVLAMSSAEHPEMAILGFPGAHVSETSAGRPHPATDESTVFESEAGGEEAVFGVHF